MRRTRINGRWPLILPAHRAEFHEQRPWWEAARLADISAHRKDMKCLIDVGSEEGDFTALYASWGLNVPFIDPSRAWRDQTLTIFQQNDLPLPVSFTGFADNYNYIEGKPVHEARFATIDETTIARIRLDTFVEWFGLKVDAVTMDVEGNEMRVLEGSEKLLEQDVVWWISIHGDVDPHAATPSKVHEMMREHGYRDQWLGHQHEWFYRFWR